MRLFEALFDDASLFPPARLPMPGALTAHVEHRASGHAGLVGRFVCPQAALGDLRSAMDAGGAGDAVPLELALTVPDGPEALGPAVDAVLADPRLHLRSVEVPVGSRGPVETVHALAAALPRDVVGYVEVPLQGARTALEAVRCAGHRAKLRTGGTTAQAFPAPAVLAAAIADCALLDLPFKCTAGLHHALPSVDPATGFAHHGFLNVVLAVDVARAGAAAGEVEHVLRLSDAACVADRVAALDPAHAAEVRALLVAIGTCSIDEPVADLAALGLVVP